ncbi:MAG TPA: glucose 1-dehydrogenase [Caulobacteraceae bacterium]|nr:glucose 1-dehydrogenase [Caulobacteraceae bacterium]
MDSRFDLSGRTALITGGSRGLGREMALAFARAGADVAVASRKLAACQAVAADIEGLGRRALALACHVGHWDALEPALDAVYERFGGLDILVNNAGMSPLYRTLDEVSEEAFDKVIGVNFKGPFRLTALAAARMARSRGGSVINISSIASLEASPTALPYAGAKAALNALTVGFAAAFAPKVRVNAIVAGAFGTDIADHWPDPRDPADPHWTRGGWRIGAPDEIVGAALYLASDASSFTSGALIRVDGGPVRVRREAQRAGASLSASTSAR